MNALDILYFISAADNILWHEHGRREMGLTQSNQHIVCIVNRICSFTAVSILELELCLPCLLMILFSVEMREVWRGNSEGDVFDTG